MPQDLANFLAQPFDPGMSAFRWFLFLGLIMVLLFAWRMVVMEISQVEAAIA